MAPFFQQVLPSRRQTQARVSLARTSIAHISKRWRKVSASAFLQTGLQQGNSGLADMSEAEQVAERTRMRNRCSSEYGPSGPRYCERNGLRHV